MVPTLCRDERGELWLSVQGYEVYCTLEDLLKLPEHEGLRPHYMEAVRAFKLMLHGSASDDIC